MATTLTYGRVKPATGDKGSVFFPALEDNITTNDAHNHEGTNSPKLNPEAITAKTATIANADWNLVANGIYKDTITVPSGITEVDNHTILFRIASGTDDGCFVPLRYERLTATTFDVFINDNSVDVKIIYR